MTNITTPSSIALTPDTVDLEVLFEHAPNLHAQRGIALDAWRRSVGAPIPRN